MQGVDGTRDASVDCHLFSDDAACNPSAITYDERGAEHVTLHVAFDLNFPLGDDITRNG
jgi:hypothetical protein